ncbi:MAG TPA: glycoside hydrolase family 99-like domain-containing protein [Armatimonadota bacterium]
MTNYILAAALAALVSAAAYGAGHSRIDVAAIYFPSWHSDDHYSTWFGEGWNEWTLLNEDKPRFPGHEINRPEWGAFDEADPKWMARQIDAAADHGITVFIFDWYWYNGVQILQRPVEETLPKTPNRKRIKYALMWANHTWMNIFPLGYNQPQMPMLTIRHSAADFQRMMAHCIKVHFRQPNYWRVNGALYFSLFQPAEFINQLGGAEKAKAVLDAARAQVRKAGLGEVHFAGFVWDAETARLCEQAGFDSLTSYNCAAAGHLPDQPTEEYDRMAARHEDMWKSGDSSRLPYSPVVTAGWDVTPRWDPKAPWPPAVDGYPYTPLAINNTPAKFGALCSKARAFAETSAKHPPAVTVNSWNEWTEGGAILPGTRFGSGYLDELKKAFSD